MADRRVVIDIGPARGRANYPGVTSDGYSIELYLLEEARYRWLVSIPWP